MVLLPGGPLNRMVYSVNKQDRLATQTDDKLDRNCSSVCLRSSFGKTVSRRIAVIIGTNHHQLPCNKQAIFSHLLLSNFHLAIGLALILRWAAIIFSRTLPGVLR